MDAVGTVVCCLSVAYLLCCPSFAGINCLPNMIHVWFMLCGISFLAVSRYRLDNFLLQLVGGGGGGGDILQV